jgi:branched-chain amino acid transport system permease protein
MDDLLIIIVFGLTSAAIYAVAASGLVLTYTTSGIFNFAHGAIAMFCAYVYWQLSSPDAWGLPVPVSLALTLLVFAPALGLFIDRVLMRGLADASPIIRLVVPIGLLVALIQLASIIWPPNEVIATLPEFFLGERVHIGDVAVTYHQLITMAVAVAVAVALRLVLYTTRIGIAMRGVVDDRGLAALNGANPRRVSTLAWALGCVLAGIAGILVAPILRLDQIQLTFLVINAYAAAMVGRLRSLPLTAVGALILGIAREVVRHYDASMPSWISVDTVPVLMLFAVLLLVPQEKAAVFGARQDRSRIPKPTFTEAVLAAGGLVAVAVIIPSVMTGNVFNAVGSGLALGVIALSLVPLTGLGGQISLAPLAFAGIGAVVMRLVAPDGNPLGLVPVIVVCAVIGALVALPTLRLRGLYLALATMAFALFCEKAIFTQVDSFRSNAPFPRFEIGGLGVTSDRAYMVLMAAVIGVLGIAITVLRRGSFGRRLQAMKDSPAGCATVGLDVARLKVEVFALSAAIAGVGGVLLAQWRTQAGPTQFALLEGAVPALPLVLMTVVGGIAAVSGAVFGAMLIVMFPIIGQTYPALENLMIIAPGLAGISLAANPDGAVAQTAKQVSAAIERRRAKRRGALDIDDRQATGPGALAARMRSLLVPPRDPALPEAIPIGGGTTRAQLDDLDGELGVRWGRCDVDPRSA